VTDSPGPAEPALPASDRVRPRRKPDRGRYDRATIDAILDAALIGHVGWVLDGQPYATPTAIWRRGDRLYWHGSAGSRMVRETKDGAPVCITATILDGLGLDKGQGSAPPLVELDRLDAEEPVERGGRPADPVDPAEAQGLVDRLRPRHGRRTGALLVQADDHLGRAGVVVLEPRAPVPRGGEEDRLWVGRHGVTVTCRANPQKGGGSGHAPVDVSRTR